MASAFLILNKIWSHEQIHSTEWHIILVSYAKDKKDLNMFTLIALVESTLGVTVGNSSEVVSQLELWVQGQGCNTFPLFVSQRLTLNVKIGCSKAGTVQYRSRANKDVNIL